MLTSHKFLIVTFLAGLGCLNASEATVGMFSRFFNDFKNHYSNYEYTLPEDNGRISSFSIVDDTATFGYVSESVHLTDFEESAPFLIQKVKEIYSSTIDGFKVDNLKVEEKAPVSVESGYNVPKITLISAGALVAALVTYKIYQYVQCLTIDEQELISSILVAASEESQLKAFEKIVSWADIEVVRNAEPIMLANNQIKSVLKHVARIKSTQAKKLVIATMLTHFDMNEKTRKNVVAKLRSL